MEGIAQLPDTLAIAAGVELSGKAAGLPGGAQAANWLLVLRHESSCFTSARRVSLSQKFPQHGNTRLLDQV
eukprot:2535038-Amphidinium_carterae.6